MDMRVWNQTLGLSQWISLILADFPSSFTQTKWTSVDGLNQVWPVPAMGSPELELELNARGQMCLVRVADTNTTWHPEPPVMMAVFRHAHTMKVFFEWPFQMGSWNKWKMCQKITSQEFYFQSFPDGAVKLWMHLPQKHQISRVVIKVSHWAFKSS